MDEFDMEVAVEEAKNSTVANEIPKESKVSKKHSCCYTCFMALCCCKTVNTEEY